MRNFIAFVAVLIGLVLTTHFAFSYSLWDMNPMMWRPAARILEVLVVFYTCSTWAIVSYKYLTYDED